MCVSEHVAVAAPAPSSPKKPNTGTHISKQLPGALAIFDKRCQPLIRFTYCGTPAG